jgi:nucleoside-diphosphate-sugar epimerase
MILITGATGFIGGAVLQKNPNAVVLGRSRPLGFEGSYIKQEISASSDYNGCFEHINTIVHCAARVHVMKERDSNPLKAFREVNVGGTLNLARQAAASGVSRFVFISSIKVNGESTPENIRYTSNDKPAPEDPYGISKYEAEQGLVKISKETGMEMVFIRPTLVYGAGVKGNFLNLLKLSKLGFPLPFGSVHNLRSMVYLDNLVDLIAACIGHPKAAGRVFLASDGDDFSLSRLLGLIRKNMNKSPLLIPVPLIVFKLMKRLMGKQNVIDRLIGNLQVDSSDAKKYLNWHPPYTAEQGVKASVIDFMKS